MSSKVLFSIGILVYVARNLHSSHYNLLHCRVVPNILDVQCGWFIVSTMMRITVLYFGHLIVLAAAKAFNSDFCRQVTNALY